MFAKNVTFNFAECMESFGITGASNNTDHTGDIIDEVSASIGGATVTISPKDEGATTENRFWATTSGPQLRMYSGKITVSAGTNRITQIIFNVSKWNEGITASPGSLNGNNPTITWTDDDDATSVEITFGGQAQINSMVITYRNPNASYTEEINGIYYDFLTTPSSNEAYVTSGDDLYTGDVVIPDQVAYNGLWYNVTTIKDKAFKNCVELTSITIPNGIVSIGKEAFYRCFGLTSLDIPETVNSIGNFAFFNCYNLTSITVDSNNEYYESLNNALIEKNTHTLILGCKNTVIPDGVTAIGGYAFYGTELSSVTIPNSVTSIGYDAFCFCRYITSLTIPASVTSIGESAFAGCERLTSITVESGNPVYDSRNNCNAIIRTSDNQLITGCKNTVIPYGVTSIGNNAFNECYLASMIIPNSVTSIGMYVFYSCFYLTSITIPNSVTSIDYCAFASCGRLTSVKVGWTTPLSIDQEVFFDGFDYAAATLYVPSGTRDAYLAAPYWQDFGTIQEYPKCATPTISVTDGKLHFECETPGAQFIYGYTFDGAGQNIGNDVPLSSSYNVWVVAKKSGYDDSDMVTKKVDANGLLGDVNQDGKVSISDAVGVVNIILDNGGASAPAIKTLDVDKGAE